MREEGGDETRCVGDHGHGDEAHARAWVGRVDMAGKERNERADQDVREAG